MQELEDRSCHPGVGLPAACLHTHCAPPQHYASIRTRGKEVGIKSQSHTTSATGTGPAAAGHRTTHPHTDLEITTAATTARTGLYQRAIILLLLLLSASPTSYSHHRALGYRKPQAIYVPFLPRDANFPPHVHDKRKTKMTAAMERHQNSVPKGTTLAAATQQREPVLRGSPPPCPYITQTARKK